jgi:alpha-D-xyloside xylohydrolase
MVDKRYWRISWWKFYDSEFKELLIRWFEFAVYCPILRMHGDREPHEFPIDNQVEGTGAPNEIWSFGKETFDILRKQVNIREVLSHTLILV